MPFNDLLKKNIESCEFLLRGSFATPSARTGTVSKDLQDVLDACAGGGRAVRRLVISSEWQSHNMMAVIVSNRLQVSMSTCAKTQKNLVTHAREMGVKVDMEPDTIYCEILFDTPPDAE